MLALMVALGGCASTGTTSTPERQTPAAEATSPGSSPPASEPEAQLEERTESEPSTEEETEPAPENEETAEPESESSPGGGGGFCSTHSCIPSYEDGHGYPVECADGEWSKSGGISGACSGHGGEKE